MGCAEPSLLEEVGSGSVRGPRAGELGRGLLVNSERFALALEAYR